MIVPIKKAMFAGQKPLDFIVIGAQKSATTSIYRYLQDHPMIEMPANKEAPFFCSNDVSAEALQHFNALHFGDSNTSKLRGKVSPQYMSSPKIPELIAQMMPNTKLIALLRDPISRSFSHYRMARRRGTEEREFSEIVQHQLFSSAQTELSAGRSRAAPLHESGYVSESDFIIAWSEYGRILDAYFQHFSREQILVLFTDELHNNPESVLRRIMSFLGLDADYEPENLGQTFHQGGDTQWVSNQQRSAVVSLPLVRNLWNLVPEQSKQELRYWFEQRNIRKSPDGLQIDKESEGKLRKHFYLDMQLLAESVQLPKSWMKKYGLDYV